MLISVPFYWFDQKQLFKQIQISTGFAPFQTSLRKINFLSISLPLSEIVNFWIKREFFNELARKCFKPTGKHNLAVCGSFLLRKTFFVYICPVSLL